MVPILGKKILIIEDETEFFFFYTMMLEDTDYVILHAVDGNDAFEKIEEDKPDLIILDLLLDQMTGDAFLRQLKSNPAYASIPIIIASSFSPRSYKTIFELDTNLIFLEKPFTQEKLLAEIEAKLG
jgi:DNA-binding response OmpR family regulator